MAPLVTSEYEYCSPMGRIATVDEQVGPILFLSSALSDYITGTCLDVNGGQL